MEWGDEHFLNELKFHFFISKSHFQVLHKDPRHHTEDAAVRVRVCFPSSGGIPASCFVFPSGEKNIFNEEKSWKLLDK